MTLSLYQSPGWSDNLQLGRPNPISGDLKFCVPGCTFISVVQFPLVANFDRYAFWFTPVPLVIDQMQIDLGANATAGNVRFGFYLADTDWQPVGAPLADSGNISTSTTGVKNYTPSTPIYVPPGRYLSVINTDTATPNYNTFRGGIQSMFNTSMGSTQVVYVSVSRTYAAFPTPGSLWTGDAGSGTPNEHLVIYRVIRA